MSAEHLEGIYGVHPHPVEGVLPSHIEHQALAAGVNPLGLWAVVQALIALSTSPEGKALIAALLGLFATHPTPAPAPVPKPLP